MDTRSTNRARILRAIRSVPCGKVSTYGAIAKACRLPRAARLVAQVLHTSVGLPWHRIVGAGGQIKLSGDQFIDQRLRLQSEGVTFRGSRVRMALHEHHFATAQRKIRPGT